MNFFCRLVFFLIFDKKCRPIIFRWLLLFIAYTQAIFTEKVCFIEVTSFNYFYLDLVNPMKYTLLLFGGHSKKQQRKENVMSYLATDPLSWDQAKGSP